MDQKKTPTPVRSGKNSPSVKYVIRGNTFPVNISHFTLFPISPVSYSSVSQMKDTTQTRAPLETDLQAREGLLQCR